MSDRATVSTTAILRILQDALRARYCEGDASAISHARLEIEELLRSEFHDIQRETRDGIRPMDE
jgi:hypothetical protein